MPRPSSEAVNDDIPSRERSARGVRGQPERADDPDREFVAATRLASVVRLDEVAVARLAVYFDYWESRLALGPLARWIGALEEIVLKRVKSPVVIFVDEIDFVRALPCPTDELFAAIRDCFNRRSEETGFERLTFCLVGVATPGQLIRNPETTPFNIGTRIDLSDFTLGKTSSFM